MRQIYSGSRTQQCTCHFGEFDTTNILLSLRGGWRIDSEKNPGWLKVQTRGGDGFPQAVSFAPAFSLLNKWISNQLREHPTNNDK